MSTILFFSLLINTAFARDTTAIMEDAMEAGLHQSPAWRALLMYGPSGESVIDSPGFFLSPQGRTDPAGELSATVRALVSGGQGGDGEDKGGAACRFPARREWLDRQLGPGVLPRPHCPELEKYMKKLAPHKATLVFPEAHLNSPASMFGHTLIRIDPAGGGGLLGYAVSYAADMPDDPGPLFPLRGVIGGYRGRFSVLPYHEKLKEYTHMDSRDIWEYPLALSPGEVRLMALHVWELQEAWADYFFFDDNCSYLLLFLLDAAKEAGQGHEAKGEGPAEEKGPADGFPLWVIPADTVRSMSDRGFLNSPAFRPSRATLIRHMESLALKDTLDAATDMAEGRLKPDAFILNSPLPGEQRALATELAAEYTKQMASMRVLGQGAYKERYLGILSARSRAARLEGSYTTPPAPASPLEGHGASRVSVGYGQLEDEGYALLKWRFAYHSLDDPPGGYVPGAGISLMDVELRHINNTTVLERLGLLRISSVAPMGNFIRPLSWRLELGAQRERVLSTTTGGGRTPAILRLAAGPALGTGRGGMAYALVGPSVKLGGALDDGYAFGGFVLAGGLLRAGDAYSLMAEARAGYHSEGHAHGESGLRLVQTIRPGKASALMLDYSRQRLEGHYSSDWSFSLNLYF